MASDFALDKLGSGFVGRYAPHRVFTTAWNTAENISQEHFGAIISTRNATGDTNFSMPAADIANAGAWVKFHQVADFEMVITSASSDFVADNNVVADTITFSAATQHIGNAVTMISDGVKWFAEVKFSAIDTVFTVA